MCRRGIVVLEVDAERRDDVHLAAAVRVDDRCRDDLGVDALRHRTGGVFERHRAVGTFNGIQIQVAHELLEIFAAHDPHAKRVDVLIGVVAERDRADVAANVVGNAGVFDPDQ